MSRLFPFAIVALVCAALGLSACGKKPEDVSAPQGEANDTFPNVYPKS